VPTFLLVGSWGIIRGVPLRPPIVVAEGTDVSFYASEEAVGRELEPWFVEEDYTAFDADGRKVVLRVEQRERHGGGFRGR
jgi:hypothetical protein